MNSHLQILTFCVLAFASLLHAQDDCRISGKVSDAAGNPVTVGIVTVINTTAPERQTVGIGAGGAYQTPLLQCGTYKIEVESGGGRKIYEDIALPHGTTAVFALQAPPRGGPEAHYSKILSLGIGYALIILIYRTNNIAIADRKLLKAQISKIKLRLQNETDNPQLAAVQLAIKALDDVGGSTKLRILDFFFYSRGDDIAGWSTVHEVERQMPMFYPAGSTERLRVRLQSVEQELRQIGSPSTIALAESVKVELLVKPPNESLWRQLLSECLGAVYKSRDNDYSLLAAWQTKSMWLTVVAIAIICTLATAQGRSTFFLAGFAGGFLSRLARSMHRESIPSDYGTSWTTLFLSPLLGALSGWFGLLLLASMVELKLLGQAFTNDYAIVGPLTITLAFLFGFSERLFVGLLGQVEERFLKPAQGVTAVTTGGATNGSVADRLVTTLGDPAPPQAKAGDSVRLGGLNLDASNVHAVFLSGPGMAQRELALDEQASDHVTFTVPMDAAPGVHTILVNSRTTKDLTRSLTVKAVEAIPAANIPTETDTSLDSIDPASPRSHERVTVVGRGLTKANIRDFGVEESNGNRVASGFGLADNGTVTFVAPEAAGPYVLVLITESGSRRELPFKVLEAQ